MGVGDQDVFERTGEARLRQRTPLDVTDVVWGVRTDEVFERPTTEVADEHSRVGFLGQYTKESPSASWLACASVGESVVRPPI